jgi:NADPH-dependent 2,4-dienoyl-CoA reductase/sulfur reductase-like enzyme
LENTGEVDLINATAGVYASVDAIIPPQYVRPGWIADLAAEIKSVCSIPVMAVGRINDPYVAESIIKSNKADFVIMARQSLADPHLPNKVKEGRIEDIRQCIACNVACIGSLLAQGQVKCVLNPSLGLEHEKPRNTVSDSKKIAIIGAGPAGLQAAIELAHVGHEINVYEKNPTPGGQLSIAAIPPGKQEIAAFINWQLTQLNKLGVQVHYNKTIDEKNL